MAKSPCLGVAFSLTSLNLGVGKWSVEKQKLEGRKIELEARKIEMGARKMRDQKGLTCQKYKVKERNVANNYEKFCVHFFLSALILAILGSLQGRGEGKPAGLYASQV